ncbi:SLC13 family permease [Azospirillum picis]|uniref:Na+/H+ antiporter NhaD/arsenite permease-like protein n=1 Tax=Azospirillum picis TaxID=488438 RepID=A0ABU0MEL0_9PROT|nr:SLC13 family permease [Azospirillum picis]MBP2298037.1 Na+/H+ antiporter NhaD/arsenite permease-like protein [Azospirillum picis]MDQ0531875.1 Na+/H+ antiporter NhaD/arsenite permease-like protein [Azospirillum picis]
MTATILVLFAATYLGMALGRFPGLRIDRTGIALVAAILLLATGALDTAQVVAAVDFPTIFILLGLMILSAQYAGSGFYDWCALKVARAARSPARLLAIIVAVAGGLSAVLANDVVVFAMTPMLCLGLQARKLDPRPYLIALAGAANAGSAATMIGNPQNILIGQVGHLDFWRFVAVCGGPALVAMIIVYAVVWLVWRGRFGKPQGMGEVAPVLLDRWQLGKGVAATAVLLLLFTRDIPQEHAVLLVAGVMMISRRMASRDMLGMVDWHLLVLFAALFAINHALGLTGLPASLVRELEASGWLPDRLAVMTPLALAGSNSIGNVPAVILLLAAWPTPPEGALYGLALLSTLAGNLLLPGSLANIIVAERAAAAGVRLGFVEHARCGVPMALLSMAVAAVWLWAGGWMAL